MTIDLAFNIALGLISSLLGLVVKNLYTKIDHDRAIFDAFREKINDALMDVKVEYMLRKDAQHNHDQILDSLKEIKQKISKLDDKLSLKADK